MAQPIFLSYSWSDLDEVDQLDALLRLRGVPVWRDRRDMRFGTYQEDHVRTAIKENCSGFVLYLTEAALTGTSEFITGIELPAMADRRSARAAFLSGAVFRGYGFTEGQDAVHKATGIPVGSTLGSRVSTLTEIRPQLLEAANAILTGYLAAQHADGPTEIVFDTRNDIRWTREGLLHLGWFPPLAHEVADVDPDSWLNELQPALDDVRRALIATTDDRRLILTGTPHLSAALAFGYEFRRPAGWSLEMHDTYGGTWVSTNDAPDLSGWRSAVEPGPSGSDDVLVVAIHARHDISAAVRANRAQEGTARATLHVRPPAEAPAESINPAEASSLAAAITDAIRAAHREYGTRQTHLYLAGPWPMAVLLGWHLASTGPLVSFEATADRQGYRPACRLT